LRSAGVIAAIARLGRPVAFLNGKTATRPNVPRAGQTRCRRNLWDGTMVRRGRLIDAVGVCSGAAPLRSSAPARSPPRSFAAPCPARLSHGRRMRHLTRRKLEKASLVQRTRFRRGPGSLLEQQAENLAPVARGLASRRVGKTLRQECLERCFALARRFRHAREGPLRALDRTRLARNPDFPSPGSFPRIAALHDNGVVGGHEFDVI
jgi:hypothetical protein